MVLMTMQLDTTTEFLGSDKAIFHYKRNNLVCSDAYKDNTAVYDTVRGLARATRRLGSRKGDAALDASCPNMDKARHRVQFWSLVCT